MRRVFMLAVSLAIGCGDDGGGSATTSGPATIGPADDGSASSSDGPGSTGEGTGAEASATDPSSTGGADTGEADTTTAPADDTSGTTGEPADPAYPAPDRSGACPEGTANLQLPGASACAPFCAGEGAACPAAATGNPTPECTPFEMKGGSGTPCASTDDCTGDEACGMDGACIAVAFWGCRLLCDANAICPDAMICSSVGACGYP